MVDRIQPPVPAEPFVDQGGRLSAKTLQLLQQIIDRLDGTEDESGFLTTMIMGVRVTVGAGSPAGIVVGSPPDIYLNTAGGIGSTVYYKASGAATTAGWQAVP